MAGGGRAGGEVAIKIFSYNLTYEKENILTMSLVVDLKKQFWNMLFLRMLIYTLDLIWK